MVEVRKSDHRMRPEEGKNGASRAPARFVSQPSYRTFAILSANTLKGTDVPYVLPTPPPLHPPIACLCSSLITARAASAQVWRSEWNVSLRSVMPMERRWRPNHFDHAPLHAPWVSCFNSENNISASVSVLRVRLAS